MPTPITPDQTAQDIIDDIVQTLQGLTVNGASAFTAVTVIANVDDFLDVSDPLAGNYCGVVGARPSTHFGTDNDMEFVAKLDVSIVIQTFAQIGPKFDTTQATKDLDRLADIVRQGVRVDPTRGGNACRVKWRGQFIDGTSIDGEPRPLRAKKRQNTFALLIPVTCGYVRNVDD